MTTDMSIAPTVGPYRKSCLVACLCLPWLNPFAGNPSPAVTQWLVTLACVAVLLLIARRDDDMAELAAWAWLAAAVISGVMGLLQYSGHAGSLTPWVHSGAPGEAYANLRQRNQFATLLNIGVAALCWIAAQRRPAPTMLLQTVLVASAVLLGVANAASSSRTGLLQLILLTALIGWWGGLRHAPTRRVLVLALGGYAIAVVALPALMGLHPAEHGMVARLHDTEVDCASRLVLWRNVLHLIALKPWLGWGWGELDYAHFMTLYEGPRFCSILGNAHNLPLQLAVELGVPAASVILGAATWLVLRTKPWHEADTSRQLAWAVLAVILLHSMLEYPLWYGPFQLAFWLCVYLLWCKSRTPTTGRGTASVVQRALASVLLLAVAYAAWDYHCISQIYLQPEQRSARYRDHTLEKIKGSWLFDKQVSFAELSITPLTRDNAQRINVQAKALLHYSPEARVAERLIESAVMLGQDEEAKFFLQRYRTAFPAEHAQWVKALAAKPK
jgi:O-antigen ligase